MKIHLSRIPTVKLLFIVLCMVQPDFVNAQSEQASQLINSGNVLADSGKHTLAIRKFKAAISLIDNTDERYYEAHLALASSCYYMGDLRGCMEAIDVAYNSPDKVEKFSALVQLLHTLKRFHEVDDGTDKKRKVAIYEGMKAVYDEARSIFPGNNEIDIFQDWLKENAKTHKQIKADAETDEKRSQSSLDWIALVNEYVEISRSSADKTEIQNKIKRFFKTFFSKYGLLQNDMDRDLKVKIPYYDGRDHVLADFLYIASHQNDADMIKAYGAALSNVTDLFSAEIPEKTPKTHKRAIHIAIENGNIKAVTALIYFQSIRQMLTYDPPDDESTVHCNPIIYAVALGELEIAHELIRQVTTSSELGLSETYQGKTLIAWLVEQQDFKSLDRLFRDHNFDIFSEFKMNGETKVTVFDYALANDKTDVIIELLARKTDRTSINSARGSSGLPPIFDAVKANNTQLVHYLLFHREYKYIIQFEFTESNRATTLTLLDYANRYGSREIIQRVKNAIRLREQRR